MSALTIQLQLATAEIVVGEIADARIAGMRQEEKEQRPVMSWPLLVPAFPSRVCLDVRVGSVIQTQEYNLNCVVGVARTKEGGNFYDTAPQNASHMIGLDLNFHQSSGSISGLFARNWCEIEPAARYPIGRPLFSGGIPLFVHVEALNGFQLIEFNPHFVMCVRRV